MLPTLSTRPQTSRQARRAYLKSGQIVQCSDRELRQLERSAELQARADRIKERENKRKANLKKKNERAQKEKEARQRMGISTPVKETVGASQLRLDAFKGVGMRLKPKWEETPVLTLTSSSRESNCSSSQGLGKPAVPTRSPLKPRSANVSRKPQTKLSQEDKRSGVLPSISCDKDKFAMMAEQLELSPPRKTSPKIALQPPPPLSTSKPIEKPSPKVEAPEVLKLAARPPISSQMLPTPRPTTPVQIQTPHQPHALKIREPSIPPPPSRPIRPPIHPTASTKQVLSKLSIPCARSEKTLPPEPLPTTTSAKQMPPPPRPIHTAQLEPSAIHTKASKPPVANSVQALDDGWAAFLVSNTQIERELSTDLEDTDNAALAPNTKPKTILKPKLNPPFFPYQKHAFVSAKATIVPTLPRPAKPARDDTAALLAGICTQDLDYDAESLADTRVPAQGQEPTVEMKKAALAFGDDMISDTELEEEANHVEQRSSGETSSCSGDKQQMTGSFWDDFFDIPTQDLCELVS